MGKTSFKNTKALIQEINQQLENLEAGNLSLKDLNELVDNGNALYEQLLILRYKAYDKTDEEVIESFEEPVKEVEQPKEVEKPMETAFDFTAMNQETKTNDDQPSFDFTIDEEVEKEPESIQVDPEPKNSPVKESNSLNDVLKSEDDELSLRKKFQNSPVADLKSNISIAKKFEYINSMFAGDSKAYEESLEFLNTCATGNDARQKLNELTTKYEWDLEDKSIIKFIELVERRYL